MNEPVGTARTNTAVGPLLIRHLALLVIPMLLVVGLDRITKGWVQANIWDPPREVVLVPGWLELTPVANRGIAFGIMQEAGGALAIVAVGMLAAVAIKSWRQLLKAPGIVRLSLGLIAGGAIGNVIDRAQWGYVTDFIRVPPIVIFQVFNIADASICVGAAILAFALWWGDRERKPQPASAAPASE